ncbi:MAG: sigma 54-interacting transcriptional regulator, partial [Clostridia bacterium]|nr:sigma 54-interacting transcriptional regulator [Clostridia bacterium]
PEPLLESELFGYESGAFTGAKKSGKTGLIEVANKGTLFLDEIAEMPANLQVKLLQVLQTKCVTRVGGTEPIDVDVRIISATNKDLGKLVKTGKFRLDLYYRLNVIPVHVPPLRERKDDIMPLAENFLERLNKRYQKNVQLMPDVIQVMLNYSWPGNIRELENLIERIVVVSTKNKITIEDLPYFYSLYVDKPVVVNKVIPLNQAINDLEQQMVSLAYKKCKNSYKLGKILGISQSSAHRKIKKYIKESNEKEYNSSVNYSNPPMN